MTKSKTVMKKRLGSRLPVVIHAFMKGFQLFGTFFIQFLHALKRNFCKDERRVCVYSWMTHFVTTFPCSRHFSGFRSWFLQSMKALFSARQRTATCFAMDIKTAETGSVTSSEAIVRFPQREMKTLTKSIDAAKQSLQK